MKTLKTGLNFFIDILGDAENIAGELNSGKGFYYIKRRLEQIKQLKKGIVTNSDTSLILNLIKYYGKGIEMIFGGAKIILAGAKIVFSKPNLSKKKVSKKIKRKEKRSIFAGEAARRHDCDKRKLRTRRFLFPL